MLVPFCLIYAFPRPGTHSLSLWERAGVRVLWVGEEALTLTLSQRERGSLLVLPGVD